MYGKLVKFERDCKDDFDLIKESFDEFNIFNVLGVQRREIRHSNFLGWLFDPNESHNLGDVFLIELLKVVSDAGSLSSEKLEQLLESDLSDTIVHRESENNIDILIINRELDFVICIENKIDHHFTEGQLKKYYKYVKKTYPYIKHPCYVTLTPQNSNKHRIEKKGKKYNNVSYLDIISILSNNEEAIKSAKSTVKESINQYKKMVMKEITKTSEEILLAQKIYKEFKEEINFIIRNQENFSSYKNSLLNEIKGGLLKGFSVSHDSDNRDLIFILPENENLRELFYYPNAKSRGGDYIFSLVIYFVKDVVWLKFGFGDIEDSNENALKTRTKFHNEMHKNFKVFDTNYDAKLYFDKHDFEYKDDFPGIAGVRILDDSDLSDPNKSFTNVFVERFAIVNEKIIQPWVNECIAKFK